MGRGIRPVNLTGSNQAIRTTASAYHGFSIRETSGSATATVVIYDNASGNSGPILDEIKLASGTALQAYYPGEGLRADFGIYVSVVSGAIEGSVRVS